MPKRKHSEVTPDLSWVEDHVAAASIAYKKENFNDAGDKVKLDQAWEFYKSIEGRSGVKLKIWISPNNGNVLVSFRGTSSAKEMKLDAMVGSEIFRNAKGENVGYVYKGFGVGWQDIKSQLEDELKILKQTSYIPDGSVLQFSGHSLGGSLAEIASTYFSDVYPNAMVTETSIGAPSTGDTHFGDYSRSRPNLQRTRIVAPGDPIANTKLPGMDFVEKQNVINFMSKNKKGPGTKLWDTFVKTLAMTAPGLAVANHLYDSYNNHTLSSYTDTLVKDFQDSSILTLQDDPNTIINVQQDNYEKSKTSSNPVEDGSCLCECHLYDQAIAEGKIPPQSLGLTPTMQNPSNLIEPNRTNQPQNVAIQNAILAPIQQSGEMDLDTSELSEKEVNDMDSSEFMNAVNEGLERQKEKTQEKINKLQEKYSLLTNQQDKEGDPVTLERERFSRASEDIGYFENRIDMEINYPQYVPNDSDGSTTSRDKAVKLKNRLNKIYSLIMQERSKSMAKTLDPNSKKDERTDEQKTNEIIADQSEQISETMRDNQLDPELQPNNYIFDLDLLSDLEGDGSQSSKQLNEWLNYDSMTPNSLYDQLKTIAVNEYKQGRLKELRDKEQTTRETAAADIKKEIDSYSNADGTGTFDKMQAKRKDMLVQLSTNSRILKLYKAGKLNIDKIMEDYKAEGDDVKILSSIMGYSAEDQQKMIDEYTKEFMDTIPRTDPVTYAQKMKEFNDLMVINSKYPWVNKKNFGDLYNAYKDKPDELAKKANELRPTIPATYLTNVGNFDVDTDVLSKQVEALPDASSKIQSVKFVDAYAKEKENLENKYNNPQELQKLFQQWNNYNKDKDTLSTVADAFTGGFFTTKMFNAWEKIANGNQATNGWFSKDGTWLGYAASPDFEAYARSHPEMGYKYVGPTTNKFLDLMDSVNEMAGEYAGARFGVNPNTLRDSATNITGLNSKTDYDKATGVMSNNKDEKKDDMSSLTEAFNPMGMMMAMNSGGGKDDDNDMKGETNVGNRNTTRVDASNRRTSTRSNTTGRRIRPRPRVGRR
jgi:hypothetical protein